MNRITAWRLRTGRTKRHKPKGAPEYRALGMWVAKKHFRFFLEEFPQDLRQEIEICALEAERFNAQPWRVKKHEVQGVYVFSRSVYRHIYAAAKRYGYFREKGLGQMLPRPKHQPHENELIFESPSEIIFELKLRFPRELFQSALDGDKEAIQQIKEVIWKSN